MHKTYLFRNGLVREFYSLKALITLEQVNTLVVEKKTLMANWSGVVNFHCMKMSLVMRRRWLKWRDMFIAFSCIYTSVLNQFRNKSSNTEYSTVDQVRSWKMFSEETPFRVELIASSFRIQSPSKLDLTLERASCLEEVWRSLRFNTLNGLLNMLVRCLF